MGFGGYRNEAYAINNSGQIVGYSLNNSIDMRACIYDSAGGEAKDLGAGCAYSINDNGWIVGASFDRAYLYDSTGNFQNTNLGILPGWDSSFAYSINNSNKIVGWLSLTYGDEVYGRACLFDATGQGNNIDLGSVDGYLYSEARAINDHGQIVGAAFNEYYSQRHACLFDSTGNGNNTDLNTLINPALDWTLCDAYSINNNGWIVGVGINPGGDYHAFLLTPEPATLLLFAFGTLILRRKR
jgi:probable HAF family extracellular repeat protein